jgi:hypothetical protein
MLARFLGPCNIQKGLGPRNLRPCCIADRTFHNFNTSENRIHFNTV